MTDFYHKWQSAAAFLFLCALLMVGAPQAAAQTPASGKVKVTGVVKDTFGAPLTGVLVIESGTGNGTTTASDGTFELSVRESAVLEVSYLGFVTQSIDTTNKTSFDIVMGEDTFSMDEIVVIGYGSIKRGDVTSAVASVKKDGFIKGIVKSPEQLLQGKVAGLQINNPSGNPVLGLEMTIRGVNSLTGSTTPLVVIDGIPGGSLGAISSEDIESIDVLKDGSAAAIYGSRGSNGVIIVTTRQGHSGEASLEYNGSVSLETLSHKVDMLTASDYRKYKDDPAFPGIVDEGKSTDWLDAVTRLAVSHNHYLSLRGGNQKTSYVASVDYRDRKGVIKNSDRESITAKVGLNHNMFDNKLRIQLNINDSYVVQNRIWDGAYMYALQQNPTRPIYDDNGDYTDYKMNLKPLNPVMLINEEGDNENYNQLMLNGKITYSPIRELNLSVMGSMQRFDRIENKSNTFKHSSTTMNGDDGNVWNWASNKFEKLLELVADYSKNFNGHNVTGMVGYSYQYNDNKYLSQWARGFENDLHGPWNIGAMKTLDNENASMSSSRDDNTYISFFGRVSYSYKDRYMLMASFRRDGSSRFGSGNKWGSFPAISAGWRISNESFMEGARFIDDLKLRLGYGVTGTEIGSSYTSLTLLGYGNYGYLNGEWIQGTGPIQTPNPNIRWEKKKEFNVGLDFGMFNNRFSGSVDFYQRKTTDLLGWYNIATPPSLLTSTMANVGSIRNRGVEVMLSGKVVQTKNFYLDLTGTFSYNKNEITSLSNDFYKKDYWYEGVAGSPIQTHTHIVSEGGSVGDFHGYRTAGLTDQGKWQIYNADGDIIPLSAAQDSDKTVIGNGVPTTYASLIISMGFKGFDFSLALRGAFDYQILNMQRMHWETISRIGEANLPRSVLDKPFGSGAYVNDSPAVQSHYVENGNYVKLDNISLGYTFNLKSKTVKRLRVYATGYNVLTMTKYKGQNPEVSIKGLSPGTEGTTSGYLYPVTSVYTLGVNLAF